MAIAQHTDQEEEEEEEEEGPIDYQHGHFSSVPSRSRVDGPSRLRISKLRLTFVGHPHRRTPSPPTLPIHLLHTFSPSPPPSTFPSSHSDFVAPVPPSSCPPHYGRHQPHQTIARLQDGSALVVTVATYKTPQDHNINKVGIEPDFLVSCKSGENVRVCACKCLCQCPWVYTCVCECFLRDCVSVWLF